MNEEDDDQDDEDEAAENRRHIVKTFGDDSLYVFMPSMRALKFRRRKNDSHTFCR